MQPETRQGHEYDLAMIAWVADGGRLDKQGDPPETGGPAEALEPEVPMLATSCRR